MPPVHPSEERGEPLPSPKGRTQHQPCPFLQSFLYYLNIFLLLPTWSHLHKTLRFGHTDHPPPPTPPPEKYSMLLCSNPDGQPGFIRVGRWCKGKCPGWYGWVTGVLLCLPQTYPGTLGKSRVASQPQTALAIIACHSIHQSEQSLVTS